MAALSLHTAVGNYGHTKPLKDGAANSDRFDLDHVEVSPVIAIFRRMVRGLEFDVAELALSTYLCSRAHNKPFTAIPIFLVRGFHHGAISYNTKSGIQSPKDLEGRRVGVRGYTVTTGVWVRGILQSVYGVDLNKVTWVLSGDDHVAEYVYPPNVVPMGDGDLASMLVSGEIDAAIGAGAVDSPDVQPLIPDARNAGIEYFKSTGVYPINHTLVIKNEVIAANPWLPEELFGVFKQAKETYLKGLRAGEHDSPQDQAMLEMAKVVGDDPMPYGFEAAQKTLETFIQFNLDQKVLTEKIDPESVFAPSTLKL